MSDTKIPPQNYDKTLDVLRTELERESLLEPVRNYIGASSIGDPCRRKVWYRFHRKDLREVFDSETLLRFQDGHRSEDVMADYLRKVPCVELITHTPDGGQYGFKDGSFSGHYDGVIRGLLEAPKTWHIWEHKAVNEKSFAKIISLRAEDSLTALQKWNPTYYDQAIVYMDRENLTRHYLTVSTPGVRDFISVRTHANPDYAKAINMRAKRIEKAKEPPERIGGSDWYQCKGYRCFAYEECHGIPLPPKKKKK